eukprot:SAG31_NODE_20779_length_565_cov_1.291845_1_plen_92_part_00
MQFGMLEGVDGVVSPLLTPISGEIQAINGSLLQEPMQLSVAADADDYDAATAAWLIEIDSYADEETEEIDWLELILPSANSIYHAGRAKQP